MKSTDHAKILIVEDEGIIANHLASRLLIAGYEVTGIAQSAEEAMEKIRECVPELILMDIHIKGLLDGIETTTVLRERSDIPVIYLTAHSDQKTVDRAKLTGASGFLTKPIHYAALGNAIEMALNNHHAEREVRYERAWMRTVLDTIKDAIIVINGERKIQFLNGPAELLTGWRNEAARDLDVGLILPLAQSLSGLHADEALQLPGNPQPPWRLPLGLIASKHSGQWFRIEGEIAPSIDGEKVVGAVIQFGDAASRHDEEVELRQGNKMQAVGRLAAGVAHDFNNLLFIILGCTDELIERTKPGVPTPDALTMIRKAGENAATITDQLLKFSRKESKIRREVSLNELIRQEEELLRRLAGAEVNWEFKLDPSVGAVWAEHGQLQQVLTNLVSNARDAMPAGGKLTIETVNADSRGADAGGKQHDRFTLLKVTDTGTGMSAETAEHLFEPFFTTKESGKGTGLGLAIVHNIVEDLGGTIRAESRPGKGAVFTMSVPWSSTGGDAAVVEKQRGHRQGRDTADGAAATVLLIDDEAGVRHLLRDYLTDEGYGVLEAESGEEGIRVANDHGGQIDMLITDVVMPNASGFEIARALTQTRPGIKTLFISGYAADFIDGEGMINGESLAPGARFLLKPFVRMELLENVRELLGTEAALSARASN